jgi:8-oxo-dGTP pyrophosphatase MutT (NUDIX family)
VKLVERRAARVLLLAHDTVLLIEGHDPADPASGRWWHVPGGGIDDGETVEAAAVREIFEETGLQVTEADLSPVVATREAEFDFDRRHFRQSERFFAVDVQQFAVRVDGWEPIEQRSLLDHRWWSFAELESTDEVVYPPALPALVRAVRAGPIDPPMVLE